MATKPATLPRWATDLTNNTAPTSGQQDTGWTSNQVAVSSYFNYLAELVYRWMAYLNDGALTGNHTIAGTLGVTGDVDITAGELDVSGDITAGGDVYHGNQSITCPFAFLIAGDWSYNAGGYIDHAGNSDGELALAGLCTGDRLKTVGFNYYRAGASAAALTVTVTIYHLRPDFGGSSAVTKTSIGSATVTNPSTVWSSGNSINVTDTTLIDGDTLVAELAQTEDGGTPATKIRLSPFVLTFDRPDPTP